jgi:hypothetical protein
MRKALGLLLVSGSPGIRVRDAELARHRETLAEQLMVDGDPKVRRGEWVGDRDQGKVDEVPVTG